MTQLTIRRKADGKIYRTAGDVLTDEIGRESFQDAMLGITMIGCKWFISYMPTNGKVRIYRYYLDELYEVLPSLQEENERLREALRFYAAERSWQELENLESFASYPTALKDLGSIARAALEKGEGK